MISCSVISIGSELLSGQIINRNAPWISSQLFNLGVDTVFQITVDDKIPDIVEALNLAASKSALIFCTGGLGPTSDDLTRQAVSKWLNDPLVFHADSWDHITEIFQRFQIKPPEANQQQCYFPSQAKVMFNRAGTANAFSVVSEKNSLIVLPGPPKEIDAIWLEHVNDFLLKTIDPNQKKSFFSWRTIGKGESHIAEIVESICSDLINSNSIDLAYRAHAPFIETKIRFNKSSEKTVGPYLDRLAAALDPWLYESGDSNWCQDFTELLKRKDKVIFFDFATSGHLQTLLVPWLEKKPKQAPENRDQTEIIFVNSLGHTNTTSLLESLKNSLQIHFMVKASETPDFWDIESWDQTNTYRHTFPIPYRGGKGDALANFRSERNALAIAALAIKQWFIDLSTGNSR